MILAGDYVKIKNKENYEGLIGKVLAFRGVSYEVYLLESKKTIPCSENELQKIPKDKFKKQKRDELSEKLENLIKKFEPDDKYEEQIKTAYENLRLFRDKYPFSKYPQRINDLTPKDLYRNLSNEMGEFSYWIEYKLKGLGDLNLYATVYQNASQQVDDFKELLHDVVDDKISLTDKIDAKWEKISGMGGDKILVKKIVCSFNDKLIPIFNTKHLEHFFNCVIGKEGYPGDYDGKSLGEKYEFLMNKLMKLKNSVPKTKDWENVRFSLFLYANFPPPGKVKWVK
ncbi:hypothetical protein LCGC14_0959990 [marine sediment metagenome]|uniref:Uncharacterized protein n=1 Tax=marine sediment metagenome TaxID=412755 RepID=A0A0F9NER7_9ZZZZ